MRADGNVPAGLAGAGGFAENTAETRDEALANVREPIAACLEVWAERGFPPAIETVQVEVAV